MEGNGVARWLVRDRWARASVGFGLRVGACAGVSVVWRAGRESVGILAFVWRCLPSGDCAVWSGRLGVGAGLGMHDRRGMDVGCESGAAACVLRPAHRSFALADIS